MPRGPETNVRLMGLGYSAGSALTGPVLVGLLIDWAANSLPWCTIAGVFLGMASMLVVLARWMKAAG